MMTALQHPLVSQYLTKLRHEALQLPPDQAAELRANIEEHLSAALAGEPDEAKVREILGRLGDPSELVNEAAGMGKPAESNINRPGRGRLEAGAVVLLIAAAVSLPLLLGAVPLITRAYLISALPWLVGLVLLIIAHRWRVSEKVLGSLSLGLLPFSFTVVLFSLSILPGILMCKGEECPVVPPTAMWLIWLVPALSLAHLAFTIWATTRLLRAARRP